MVTVHYVCWEAFSKSISVHVFIPLYMYILTSVLSVHLTLRNFFVLGGAETLLILGERKPFLIIPRNDGISFYARESRQSHNQDTHNELN